MSDLFDVKLVAKEGGVATVDVWITSPEAEPFPLDRAFAVQLLASNHHATLLGEALSPRLSQISNDPSIARGFVRSVQVDSAGRLPDPAAIAGWRHQLGQLPGLRFLVPKARYRIELVDSSWLNDQRAGQRWSSAAFSAPDDEELAREAART